MVFPSSNTVSNKVQLFSTMQHTALIPRAYRYNTKVLKMPATSSLHAKKINESSQNIPFCSIAGLASAADVINRTRKCSAATSFSNATDGDRHRPASARIKPHPDDKKSKCWLGNSLNRYFYHATMANTRT
jgi:hypothetical protein